MKNKLLSTLLMVTIISVLTLGCKKKSDEQQTPTSTCETKYEVMYGESASSSGTASVNYENGQIKSINSNESKLLYEYSANQVIVSSTGTPIYRIDLIGKLASKITDLTKPFEQRMTYDGNGNLVKIEAYFDGGLTDTKTFTYSNGNLATLTQTYPEDPSVKKLTTYSYSSEIASTVDNETRNLLFGSIDQIIPTFLTGSISKNVLAGSVYTNTSDNFRTDETKTYLYTQNDNRMLNKIVEDSHTVTVSNGIQTQDEKFKRTIVITSSCN